jgi:hypothetical protein
MRAKDDLQRKIHAQSRKYALRFIAALVMAAACCVSLVNSIIWLTDRLISRMAEGGP